MKKKFLPALILLAAMTALSACGSAGDAAADSSTAESKSSVSKSASVQGQSAQEKPLDLFSTDATLAETVLMDENGVKITATGLTYTAYSADLALTIENNSGKDLSFVSGSLGYSCNSVNGYMVNDGYLNCSVASGKKANDTISFRCDALRFYGINEIADLEIGISMTDASYNTTYTGPLALKTSAFETHDYGAESYQEAIGSKAAMDAFGYEVVHFSQEPLYDQSGVKLLSSGIITNRNGETALLLELENTTENMVYLSASDVAINGLLVNSSVWSNDAINPGKRCIVNVELASVLDPVCWDVYGITQVGSVSLSLGQRNADGVEIAAETPIEIAIPGVRAAFDGSGTEVYNDNGLKIVLKAVEEDSSDYSSDLHVLLLAENNSGKTLTVDDVYESLSVNGFMTDYLFSGQELANGSSAVLDIRLLGSALENNQIASVSDIQEISVSLEMKEGYTTIDEPTLTLAWGQAD